MTDRYNWTQTVTIIQSTSATPTLSSHYLYNALQKNTNNHLITNKIQASVNNESSLSIILAILKKQQKNDIIQDINMLLPKKHQYQLYQTLVYYPQTNLRQLTIRDPTDDGYIMAATSSASQYHMLLLLQQFLSGTLFESQSTMTRLDLPSFPSYILLASQIKVFPQVSYLHVALVGNSHQYRKSWRKFKEMFPALVELRLTIDKEHLPLFKSLLDDINLFPWIKRLTLQSKECPKNFLSREELRNSLLQLDGLNRITAGWDMIALN